MKALSIILMVLVFGFIIYKGVTMINKKSEKPSSGGGGRSHSDENSNDNTTEDNEDELPNTRED